MLPVPDSTMANRQSARLMCPRTLHAKGEPLDTCYLTVQTRSMWGPYEVFGQARLDGRNDDESSLFRNCTIAEKASSVGAENGLRLIPEYTFHNHPPVDILVIPGGRGMSEQKRNRALIKWIVSLSKSSEITVGICTGAFLLAEAGLLNGKRATTYWQDIDLLRQQYPNVKVVENTRFVDEGHIVTSAGIDMTLRLVSRPHGETVAAWSARRIEYAYWPQAQRAAQRAGVNAK
jgi:transcriptional regulator GlxA family with amidase domain